MYLYSDPEEKREAKLKGGFRKRIRMDRELGGAGMTTTVINIKTTPDFNPRTNPNDIYIGRFHRSPKYGLFPRSKWYNPYREGVDGTLDEILSMYIAHLVDTGLIDQVHELRGKRLGCWCKPDPCHGDVLAELADEER